MRRLSVSDQAKAIKAVNDSLRDGVCDKFFHKPYNELDPQDQIDIDDLIKEMNE